MAGSNTNLYAYIEKQNRFRIMVKEIQKSIDNKEYLKEGCSYDEYIKKKWNISK
ncbi:hypothetical protein BCR36DRAFT_298655 [Piromyces finnis]|uniref:Uncharacterized protein n=1 Tax=Piromyces finnis TaxID=1754191 RepID=A0A1Y1V2A7_9FUNG|nr:hypothetical protein BCR36DRAFT_298655 [Piromyces finnis]|eukprot:ORX45736.1 hypothetical protein BCR36DRAFT_298655 [Piromyces finnis]